MASDREVTYPKKRQACIFDKIKPSKWQFQSHCNFNTCVTRIESRKVFGILIMRESTTRKIYGGDGFGKSKTVYFIENGNTEFKTVPALIRRLKEIVRERKSNKK